MMSLGEPGNLPPILRNHSDDIWCIGLQNSFNISSILKQLTPMKQQETESKKQN
jgi:hypothetical protein